MNALIGENSWPHAISTPAPWHLAALAATSLARTNKMRKIVPPFGMPM